MNEVMSKVGVGVVFRSLLNFDIDVEGLLMGLEDYSFMGIEMVVLVEEVFMRKGVGVGEVKEE